MSIPDARRAGPGIGWREKRAGPKHAAVWVRVDGRWRKGRIIEWIRDLDRPSWDVVLVPDEPRRNEPLAGRYAYDRQTIRPRYNDSPPGEGRLTSSAEPLGQLLHSPLQPVHAGAGPLVRLPGRIPRSGPR